MTSVEKRRSGRKSSGHRKHSDGGFSDTSSGGSFLDETDREVSNLTDRAFRSLCIGDEAVYNDSDLSSSSPCIQRDRQLAFCHSGPDGEDREREELKRAAHESFSVRVQQYGQDWIHGRMCGAEILRDPQWGAYGERTQGRVSATFQHSFMEMSQQEESLKEEQLNLFSNGGTELSSQQRRSRSRVSSLIRAFNSEGQKGGVGMEGRVREWNNETSWDRSALMNMQRELSEFSSSYQQNINSGHFPSAGPFAPQEGHFHTSEVSAHMNADSYFMRSSHSKHSMLTQVNCNSNVFIHSEFSPFKVWRDHNRFPFQEGQVSGFMHCSEFPKWCQTPMYKELSLEAPPRAPSMFDERNMRHQRHTMAPVVSPNPQRSISTSTMLQKTSALEKRCESELAGHYPHRMRAQSVGTNRLPSKRPSTASPTIEMSRRVQDTISSVKALQQKIKMMTEQNIETDWTAHQQGALCSNENWTHSGYSALTAAPNVASSNTSSAPFNISQVPSPKVTLNPEAEASSDLQHYEAASQPVEHAPVRAESRGATPDVRMSGYKSRVPSLLFNLKDNRKRVKSTYSPPKFKGLETQEKIKQASIHDPRDTVIDIPEFLEPDSQIPQVEETSWADMTSHQYAKQYHSPVLALAAVHSQPAIAHMGQHSAYTSREYQTSQGGMIHPTGFKGFIPEDYTSNQLTNGQHLHEDSSSFNPYQQSVNETIGGDVYGQRLPYRETEHNQTREYSISKENILHEAVGRESTKVDRYRQQQENENDYSNVSSQEMWRQPTSQDAEKLGVNAAISPWKQEIPTLMEKGQHAEEYPKLVVMKAELTSSPRDKYRRENQQNKEFMKMPQCAPPFIDAAQDPAYYGEPQIRTFRGEHTSQQHNRQNEDNEMKQNHWTPNYNRYANQDYRQFTETEDKIILKPETGQRKHHLPVLKQNEAQNLQLKEGELQFEDNMLKNSLFVPEKTLIPMTANQVKDKQFVMSAQDIMEQRAHHTQADQDKTQHRATTEQPKAESPQLITAVTIGSETTKVDLVKQGRIKKANVELKMADQVKTDTNEAEQQRDDQKRQTHTKLPEQTREEQTKADKTKVQHETEEPRNVTEKKQAELTIDGESEEQADIKRLKDKKAKTELAAIEQAGTEQVKLSLEKMVKTEHAESQLARVEPVERELITAEPIKTENVTAEQIEAEKRKAEQAELKVQQVKIEPVETEQVKLSREEKLKADQADIPLVKAKPVERELGKAELIKTESDTTEQSEVERRKVEQAKLNGQQVKLENEKLAEQNVEIVGKKKEKNYSVQAGQVNVEQTRTEINQTKEVKSKITIAEQMLTKAQRAKAESKLEILAKPSVKMLQQVKSEPNKVEQVRTELAKAKAELAKIKEKMRDEQKVRNTVITKEDDVPKKNTSLEVNNEEHKDQAWTTQTLKHKENTIVGSYNRDQANQGADDYESLRGKYGFTSPISMPQNKLSALNPASDNVCVTSASSPDKDEKTNAKKSKEEYPTIKLVTSKTESEEAGRFQSNEVAESHYIYSESSKEFKLSGAGEFPSIPHKRISSDTVADKEKYVCVEKPENHQKHPDVSQQKDADFAKPMERKSKSSEQSLVPGITPPRALSHKERAQTKQEILTSKIKAHAEKEISAIKEKGFALRDGFTSKNSIKQLSGSQNMNIRQRPSSLEVPRRHESAVPNNSTPKHQMEPVKSVSSSTETTSHTLDNLQKQIPEEPKRDDTLPEPPTEAKETQSYHSTPDEGLMKKKEDQPGIKSQNKEQEPKISKGKQEEYHTENPEKVNGDIMNKSDTSQAASDHEVIQEDSSPSLKLVLGQNKTSVVDDSLQIMGIMVTVKERNVDDQRYPCIRDETHAKGTEHGNAVPDKYHSSSLLEISKEKESFTVVSPGKLMDRVVQETPPTVGKVHTEVGINNEAENVKETSITENRKNKVTENGNEKRATPLPRSSYINAQREIQLQETLSGKDLPSTVTAPSKNKVPTETQCLLHKQDIMTREIKDHTKMPREDSAKSLTKEGINTDRTIPKMMQTGNINEAFTDKVVKTGIGTKQDFSAETHPSVKGDMTNTINPSMRKNIDDKGVPLLEERRRGSTPPVVLDKTSQSCHLVENRHACPKHRCKETHEGENNQLDNNCHISTGVESAVTEKDNLQIIGKDQITVSGVVVADEQVSSSSTDEKTSTLHKEGRAKTPTQRGCEKQMRENLEENLGVDHVLSSVKQPADSLKISDQDHSANAIRVQTQAENGKSEEVQKDEATSKIHQMEEDYFQVQGVTEVNKVPNNNITNGRMSEEVSKGGELPKLLQTTAAISNDCHKEGKEVFVQDQIQRKTVDNCPVSIQDENMKRHTRAIADQSALKQTDYSTDIRSGNSEKMESNQAVHIRKHHTESRSGSSARERYGSKNVTKENVTKEELGFKSKPKERVSAIPEISAIADYARLKVIVSEDRENPVPEFPPNKKEGFFPLIQSRHSRRPVFTADPQDLSMKQKSLPNKTEVPPKVIKEPKPVVFPITEKEHQRTGMFKLGEKERQEKMLLDVKDNEGVLETVAKQARGLTEREKSSQANLKDQGGREEGTGADVQRVSQTERGIHRQNNHHTQATSFTSVNKPRDTFVSQHQTLLDTSSPDDKPSAARMLHSDKESCPQLILQPMYNMKESKRQGEWTEDKSSVATIEDTRSEKRQERLITPHEETEAQSRAKHLLKSSRKTDESIAEDTRIKHVIEESRAFRTEEDRRAAQREEDRRVREREAITVEIRERREKLKDAERRAEEERKAKYMEDRRAAQREEGSRGPNQREGERRIKELEEQRRTKIREERREKLIEDEKRIKEIEERRRLKHIDQERAAQEEHQRRAALLEEQRRAKRVEEEKKVTKQAEEEKKVTKQAEEEKKRAKQAEDEKKRAKQAEEEKKQAKQAEEEKKQAKQAEEKRLAKQVEEDKRLVQIAEERRIKQIQEKKVEEQIEAQRKERQKKEGMRIQKEEKERMEKEKAVAELITKQQAEVERTRMLEEARVQKEEEAMAKKREEEKVAAQKEEMGTFLIEEQKRGAHMMDALQYYAITSSESGRKPGDRQLPSPLPSQQPNHSSGSTGLSDRRQHRPPAPTSPAPSLPRSNASSPAPGAKPSMFRVKDNSVSRGSFTKSVKPRFHRNFGEDFRVGSPMERGSGKVEEEQELMRQNSGTPVHPDMATGSTRLSAINESSILQPSSWGHDHSAPLPHHRPYSRRSFALDEDDSHSVVSNMSEDVDSFATSAADLADIRGLYDYERPDSACSFISDASRVGKPPAVPPKSEKALRRAKRLNTRRIRKELSKATTESPAEKSPQGVSSTPSSSSTEVCSPNSHAVASPHCPPPVSLAHAPPYGSCLASSHTESHLSCRSANASPHARDPVSHSIASLHATPVSLPVASHHAAPVSLPVASGNATGHTSRSVASAHATPDSLPVASPYANGYVSSPHAIGHVSHSISSPLATPVSLPAASSYVTGHTSRSVASARSTPVSLPVASPHATGYVSRSVVSPHATAPVVLPVAPHHSTGFISHSVASPHATPVSLPVSPHASGPIFHPATPKTVPHVPSSPTLLYANHPAPVTQYHVEASYPQSYPLTQRKVLQDLGSGQYYVVDAPVQVKMKTFFDPETGKYVQLKVRESGQNITQPQSQPQQMYPQHRLQPHLQVKQQQLFQYAPPAGQPIVLYQGYNSPQGHKSGGVSVHHHRSSPAILAPVSLSQEQQSFRNSPIHSYQPPENGQNSEAHCYSPEKTPYMDTVNTTEKTYNTVYNTHGSHESFPECDTNSQLAGSTAYENDNSAHSRCRPRDIITMSELEDFMEISDW